MMAMAWAKGARYNLYLATPKTYCLAHGTVFEWWGFVGVGSIGIHLVGHGVSLTGYPCIIQSLASPDRVANPLRRANFSSDVVNTEGE